MAMWGMFDVFAGYYYALFPNISRWSHSMWRMFGGCTSRESTSAFIRARMREENNESAVAGIGFAYLKK